MSSLIKEKPESSALLVFVYAFLMACFGCFLGLIYLMSFPLEPYSNLSEREKVLEGRESLDPIPGDAFYIEGLTLRTRSWETKRKQLIDGSTPTIRVSVGEINAWFEANFRSAVTKGDEETSGLEIVPDMPNIGISDDGTTYLNLPAEISGYGIDGEYVFSAQVRYNSGSPANLSVDNLQIGGAAVPLPSIFGAHVVSTIMKAFSSAEEYAVMRQAWSRVSSVEVIGGALVLSLNTP